MLERQSRALKTRRIV